MEIEYILSPHQRAEIEPILERIRIILPGWITAVSIRYNPDIKGLAQVNVMPEYRSLHVQVSDSWFSETPEEKPVHLIHEFAHAYVAAMGQVFQSTLQAYTEDGSPPRKMGEEAMRVAEEGAVSDLSRVFAALLKQET